MKSLEPIAGLCILGAMTALNAGCDTVQLPAIVEQHIGQSGESTTNLLETLRICTENARVSDKLLRSNEHPIRQQVLEKNIEQGRATAEKLLRRTDLNPEQLSKVRQAQVRLLYMAARQDSSVAEQLESFVKTLQADQADSKEHEIGQLVWMRWRYVDGDEPLDKMLAECAKFAERYPENRELATLFTLAAEKLVQDGRLNEARQCCEMAHSLLGEVPALEDMRTEVQIQQQEVKQVTRVRQKRSFEEQVLARLGGNIIGHFVLYSEDQNRQSRRRRRDFKVVYGAKAAITYARRAEQKGWQWDVVGVYPSNESGRQQARNHIATLRQNNS